MWVKIFSLRLLTNLYKSLSSTNFLTWIQPRNGQIRSKMEIWGKHTGRSRKCGKIAEKISLPNQETKPVALTSSCSWGVAVLPVVGWGDAVELDRIASVDGDAYICLTASGTCSNTCSLCNKSVKNIKLLMHHNSWCYDAILSIIIWTIDSYRW